MSSIHDEIQRLIRQYPVVVFSKTFCPYCRTAKDLLEKYSLDKEKFYHLVELDRFDKEETEKYQNELEKLTGDRSVPRIFIRSKCIGDEDDLKQLENDGKLKDLLKTGQSAEI